MKAEQEAKLLRAAAEREVRVTAIWQREGGTIASARVKEQERRNA